MSKLTTGAGLLLATFSLFIFSETASAKDSDRDGLSNKRERKIGTNPRKADTDRDTLKDGREVKRTRTNPRKADTDGDGVRDGKEIREGLNPRDPDSDDDGVSDRLERKGVIREMNALPEGTEILVERRRRGQVRSFSVLVDERTYLEGVDRNGDGALTIADFRVGNRVEINLDRSDLRRALTLELKTDDDNEVEGRVTEIAGNEITLRRKNGSTVSFLVDLDTHIRVPDRNGDGAGDFSDIEVGDKIEAYLSEAGDKALSLEVEYDDDWNDDGHKGDDDGEAEGRVLAVQGSDIIVARRGFERIITTDETTLFFGPDRNLSGRADLEDILPGDEVEIRLAPSGLAASVRFEEDDDDDNRREMEGSIVSISESAVTIEHRRHGSRTFSITEATIFQGLDRNLSGGLDWNDFLLGDEVEAKFNPLDNSLVKLELEFDEDDDDD